MQLFVLGCKQRKEIDSEYLRTDQLLNNTGNGDWNQTAQIAGSIGIVLALTVVIVLLWTRILQKQVERRIRELTLLNELLAPIHNRMPVILPPESYEQWLDPAEQPPDRLPALLRSYPAEQMTAYPVSTLVNNPQNDRPECILPVG